MSHTVAVERRSDNTFAPIPDRAAVKPGEAVRYWTGGITAQSLAHGPEFVVEDEKGEVLFRRYARTNLTQEAWLDTVAPTVEGGYTLTVHAQTYPLLPFTHSRSVYFSVSVSAPPPPGEPPGDGWKQFLPKELLGDLKPLAFAALGIVALVAVMRFTPRSK